MTDRQYKGRPPRAAAEKLKAEKKEREQRLLAVKKNGAVVETDRLDAFMAEFVKNGGNATRAAMTVFNCSSVSSAQVMGSQYLKKGRLLARYYLEEKGTTYGALLESAAKKALDPSMKNAEWFDRVMKLTDYEDFMSKQKVESGTQVNILQVQKDIVSKYVKGNVQEAELPDEEWGDE